MPGETSPKVMENTLSELIAGNNAFAFELYQAMRNKEAGNLFYSPYSISVTLAVTYAGNHSATAQQMADTLHYTLPQEQLHPAFNALDLQLTRATKMSRSRTKRTSTYRLLTHFGGSLVTHFVPNTSI